MTKTDFSVLESALSSLHAALEPLPRNDRERDGAIQRFEYTFELAWKVSAKILRDYGVSSASPRSVIRDLAQQGWIADAEMWIDFLNARNATSHIYSEAIAQQVFEAAKQFYDACCNLLGVLKSKAASC